MKKPWNDRPAEVHEYMRYRMFPETGTRMNPRWKQGLDATYTPILRYGWEHYIVGPDQDSQKKAEKIALKEAEAMREALDALARAYLNSKAWEVDRE